MKGPEPSNGRGSWGIGLMGVVVGGYTLNETTQPYCEGSSVTLNIALGTHMVLNVGTPQ